MPKHKNTELFKYIGLRIKTKRRELNLSQEKLAEILNVAYTQIYNYETGKFKIPLDYLIELANLFEVDLNYFIPNDLKNKENFKEDPGFEKMNRILRGLYKTKNADIILAAESCLNSLNAVLKKK